MLRRAADLVASARPMPLSSSVMVNRDEILDLLGQAIDKLPDELRQARWLLKEREEFLARVQSEGDEILDAASAKAESMVQRTEVVKAAEQRAKRIVEAADDEARRLRHESEDFCDQRLAQFEIVLDRTMKMVHAGREKLNSTQLTGSVPVVGAAERPRLRRHRAGAAPSSPRRLRQPRPRRRPRRGASTRTRADAAAARATGSSTRTRSDGSAPSSTSPTSGVVPAPSARSCSPCRPRPSGPWPPPRRPSPPTGRSRSTPWSRPPAPTWSSPGSSASRGRATAGAACSR